MNIFVLDKNPKKCARYHNNKHINKMVLESAQLLCNAHWKNGRKAPYKQTHINHPCTLWTCETSENYDWLYSLFKNLLKEYTYRYEKVHSSSKLLKYLKYNPCPNGKLTDFALAMPEKYKSKNAVKAYRNYYINEKAYFSKWKKREIPFWFSKV